MLTSWSKCASSRNVIKSQSGPFFLQKCYVLQLLGDFVPRPFTGALRLDPTGGFSSPRSLILDLPQLAKLAYAPGCEEDSSFSSAGSSTVLLELMTRGVHFVAVVRDSGRPPAARCGSQTRDEERATKCGGDRRCHMSFYYSGDTDTALHRAVISDPVTNCPRCWL